jgi:hypothetical protein
MESVKEVELEIAWFPAASLVSLARLKYLALSNMELDTDEEIHSISPCDVALEVAFGGFISQGRVPRSDQNPH